VRPRLEQIKNGWAARGDGWAVHGRTQDEAIRRFAEAEKRHTDLIKRPVPSPSEQPQPFAQSHSDARA
jgi:hypothetical protein